MIAADNPGQYKRLDLHLSALLCCLNFSHHVVLNEMTMPPCITYCDHAEQESNHDNMAKLTWANAMSYVCVHTQMEFVPAVET